MTGGFADPVVTALGTLIKQQIRSPNYVAGASGWSIKKDGSAEFNNLTIRGTFNGNDFIINNNGVFVYSGVPANGNLLASIAPVSGTDSFGNVYPAGITSFELMNVQSNDSHGGVVITMHTPTTLNPGSLTIFETLAGNGSMAIAVNGDTVARYTQFGSGNMKWGPGNAAQDTFLQRVALGLLGISPTLLVGSVVALGDNGVGEVQIANATTVPTTNPVGGFDLYANQGVPSVRDPGGNLLGMVRSYSVNSNADLSSFTTETDVPGATVNVVITGSNATVIVMGEFDFQVATGTGTTMVGFLNWNGSDRPEQSVFINGSITDRKTLSRTWRITGVTAGTYVAKLRASSSVSAVNNSVRNTHTGFTVLVIDQ